jgi:hypothetical protein
MDFTAALIVLLVLLAFTAMVYFAVSISRKEKERKMQVAQLLGMTPLAQPDAALEEKIFSLHHKSWVTAKYELRNVFRRLLPDGELFLFDLVDTSSDGDSSAQNQAVAIRSATLRLPPFQFYPKVDTTKYALGGLANKIVEWGVSKLGIPVNFPEFPAFDACYAVTSEDPDAMRRFFTESMARYFARTQFYTLHAADDLFVFAEIEPGFKSNDQSHMSRRVNRALEIFRLFQN